MSIYHFDNLPPSSPPAEIISDADDSTEDILPMPTSEDIPLAQAVQDKPTPYGVLGHQFHTPHPSPTSSQQVLRDGVSPHSPLEEVASGEKSDRGIMTDTSLYSEQTEQQILAARSTARRQVSRRLNQQKLQDEEKKLTESKELAALLVEASHERTRKMHFDNILGTLQENGYTLAEFLEYIFNPQNKLALDWRWKGFWKNDRTIRQIFGYWMSSAYNKSTHMLLRNIALTITETTIHRESQAITDSKILNRAAKKVNEQFFLTYSLQELGRKLREQAPNAFRVFDAFASTLRQRQRGVTEKWAEKKETVSQVAFIGKSQVLTGF